jgi:hypothetical protein
MPPTVLVRGITELTKGELLFLRFFGLLWLAIKHADVDKGN